MEGRFNHRRFILFLALSVCWMTVIFLFSSQNGEMSGNLSHGFLEWLMRLFGIDSRGLMAETLQAVNHFIRKTAHFFLYMILSVLVGNAVLATSWKTRYQILITIFFCALYAASDEFHQYFVPGRGAAARDVCIDTLGVLLGCILVYGISFLVKKHQMDWQIASFRGNCS